MEFWKWTAVTSLNSFNRRSQWPHGLRRRSATARLLRSWVRIPPEAWMFVCCKCCVLSGRGICDELITRLEESYRLWCLVVCDLQTTWMRRPWPALGRSATKNSFNQLVIVIVIVQDIVLCLKYNNKNIIYIYIYIYYFLYGSHPDILMIGWPCIIV